MKHLFTSESVSEGHPDKLADQISDAILDAYLAVDPRSTVACETFVTHKGIIVSGEFCSRAKLNGDIERIVREVVRNAGYNDNTCGYNVDKIGFCNLLHEQSPTLRLNAKNGGAGDQGLMFGYACDETPQYMPLAIWLSHRIMERQALLRKSGEYPWLLPDAKSQVTLHYDNDIPVAIKSIVVSTQHKTNLVKMHKSNNPLHLLKLDSISITPIDHDFIYDKVVNEIIKPVIPARLLNDNIEFLINPSGSFEFGGPAVDTGLTGRKIIVDTYGGSCPHGGGAFSGKDPSKVDRSAAYAARHIAKNLVASGICRNAVVQLSYAIGVAEPTSVYVNTQRSAKVPYTDEEISSIVQDIFPLTPQSISERLKLRNPIYSETSTYGHMGRENRVVTKSFNPSSSKSFTRDVELFTWEKLDYIETIRKAFNL